MADDYDLIIFSADRFGAITSEEQVERMGDRERNHPDLLQYYIEKSNKYIVYFGQYYYALNLERCIPANSKFTLFARIREMVDFINNYQTE